MQYNFRNQILKAGGGDTINVRKTAYEKSLDDFISRNPTIGNINTADFRDFLVGLVGHESSYNSRAKQGSYYGWYQAKMPVGTPEQMQHQKAFEHLNHLFNNVITKADLDRAKELGIEQAPLLLKYWNQENRVNNYLWNNKDSSDGLGTKISEYGNDLNMPLDTSKYAMDNLYGDYTIKQGDNWYDLQKRVRMPGRNYTMMGKDLWNMNQLGGIPFGNLKIGQKFNFGEAPEKPIIEEPSYYPLGDWQKKLFEEMYPHNFVENSKPMTIKFQKGNKLVYRSRNIKDTDYNLTYTPFIAEETAKSKQENAINTDILRFLTSGSSPSTYQVEEVTIYNPDTKQEQEIVQEKSQTVEQPIEETVTEETPIEETTTQGKVVYKTDINVGNMSEVIDFLANNGINFRVTSGYRPGALTSSGKVSYHSYGNAIDITPIKGETFTQLRNALNKPKIAKTLKEMGIRILDETSKEMMATTGATGPHFHLELRNNK